MSASAPDAEAPPPPPRRRSPLLHLGLLLATFITTTASGAMEVHARREGGDWLSSIVPIADGLPFSIPLMLILLCHELGHYVVARLHKVDASLPYFIPLIPGLGFGTMGAVIGMRETTRDRKKLIDIGAAGPLAGLVVAIPLLIYGLSQSPVRALSGFGMQEGNSILYALLKYSVTGMWLPGAGQDVILSPTAHGAWVGLLLTMINLLPVGQLDGGHVATAYFGNGYNRVAERLHRLLPWVAVAVFAWVMLLVHGEAGDAWDPMIGLKIALPASLFWVMWFVVIGVLRRLSGGDNHPPVDEQPLPRSRRALFWLMVLVFIANLMPVPVRASFVAPPPDQRVTQAEGRRP